MINIITETSIYQAIVFIITSIYLFVASISDFKTREVPDWLNYGAVITGLSLNLIFSIITQNKYFIINSITGFAIFFILAYVLFYTGQWGGGDSKALMGIGALIGLNIMSIKFQIPLLVTFVINTAIVGAIYGLIWSSSIALINFKKFAEGIRERLRVKNLIIIKVIIILLLLLAIILQFLPLNNPIKILFLGLSIIITLSFYMWIFISVVEKSFMEKIIDVEKITEGDWVTEEIIKDKKIILKIKNTKISQETLSKINEIIKISDPRVSISRKRIYLFPKKINLNLSDLKIGDIILEPIKTSQFNFKMETRIDQIFLDKIDSYLKLNFIPKIKIKRNILGLETETSINLVEIKLQDFALENITQQKYLCGPKDLGISKHQIELLKQLGYKKIKIKEGIPFIPSFFLAFMLTITYGNILQFIFKVF